MTKNTFVAEVTFTECVLIDIIVTISMCLGTRFNIRHGEVGTKSHQNI